jgi:hypothetical protein
LVHRWFQTLLKLKLSSFRIPTDLEEKCNHMCSVEPEQGDDPALDSGEAIFSTLGRLWSAGLIPSSAISFIHDLDE